MSAPVDHLARLDDYVSGHMADDEAAAYEDELFAAAAAGPGADGAVGEAAFVDRIARMSATLARWGGFEVAGTRAQVDQLRAAGLTVHFAELARDAPSVFPSWKEGVQIVVARLDIDLRGYGPVDVEVETPDGRPIKTFRDVECDPVDGALYAVCQEPLARLAFGRGRTLSRVIATRDGRRETVAMFDIRPA